MLDARFLIPLLFHLTEEETSANSLALPVDGATGLTGQSPGYCLNHISPELMALTLKPNGSTCLLFYLLCPGTCGHFLPP